MKKLAVLLFLLVNSALLQAADYSEGKHYKKLSSQQTSSGDKVVVEEFFWYGCPHCSTFEPYLKKWAETKPANVQFARVPAIFRPDWEVQARVYYALSNMGKVDDIHVKIFTAIHKNKKRLDKKESLIDFIVENGVDREKFLEQYNSFEVDGLVRKAKKKVKAYQIQGVPSVVVNGKYVTSGSMAGSYDNMINITNYLIAKETK